MTVSFGCSVIGKGGWSRSLWFASKDYSFAQQYEASELEMKILANMRIQWDPSCNL